VDSAADVAVDVENHNDNDNNDNNDNNDAPAQASAVEKPHPVHTPWRPTPFHERPLKSSYIIDNGERAPNQVWN
jgi:hypothetical protein